MMNEDKTTAQSVLNDEILCGMPASPASQIAMQLRLMMGKAEGEDKCTLCKAVEALEKPSINQQNNWNSSWMLLLIMLACDGFDIGSNMLDADAMAAYSEVLKKKATQVDCKLQHEESQKE